MIFFDSSEVYGQQILYNMYLLEARNLLFVFVLDSLNIFISNRQLKFIPSL